MNKTTRVLMLSLMSVAVLAGCKKAVKPEAPADTTTTTPTTPTGPTTSGMYGPGDLDTDACLRPARGVLRPGPGRLKPEFQAIMGCHAKYLRDRPSSRITLEGHADERGSREYNLGLGERRGNAVNSALQASGGSASQLTVVTTAKSVRSAPIPASPAGRRTVASRLSTRRSKPSSSR